MRVAFFIVTHCHAAARARACSGPLQKDHRRRHQRCVRWPLANAPLLRAFPANILAPLHRLPQHLPHPSSSPWLHPRRHLRRVRCAPSLNCRSFCYQTRLLFVPRQQHLRPPIPTRLRGHFSVLTPRAAACTCRTLPTTTPPTLSAGALLPRAPAAHDRSFNSPVALSVVPISTLRSCAGRTSEDTLCALSFGMQFYFPDHPPLNTLFPALSIATSLSNAPAGGGA